MNKEQELDNDMFRTNHILNAFVGASKIDKLDHEIYLYSKYFFKRLTHMIWAAPAVNICKTKQTAVE